MNRGRTFAQIAPVIGVNAATKRALNLSRQKKSRYQADQSDFADDVRIYNLEVIRLRIALPPGLGARRGKSRRSLLRFRPRHSGYFIPLSSLSGLDSPLITYVILCVF